jgi:hypothetical protein
MVLCTEPEVVFLEFHTEANAHALASRAKACFVDSAIKWQTITLADFEVQNAV